MTDEPLPHLMRAMRELRAEHRDMEVLRLRRRCQELYAEIRRLQRELAEEKGETRRFVA